MPQESDGYRKQAELRHRQTADQGAQRAGAIGNARIGRGAVRVGRDTVIVQSHGLEPVRRTDHDPIGFGAGRRNPGGHPGPGNDLEQQCDRSGQAAGPRHPSPSVPLQQHPAPPTLKPCPGTMRTTIAQAPYSGRTLFVRSFTSDTAKRIVVLTSIMSLFQRKARHPAGRAGIGRTPGVALDGGGDPPYRGDGYGSPHRYAAGLRGKPVRRPRQGSVASPALPPQL